jgi:hypothetical protein
VHAAGAAAVGAALFPEADMGHAPRPQQASIARSLASIARLVTL